MTQQVEQSKARILTIVGILWRLILGFSLTMASLWAIAKLIQPHWVIEFVASLSNYTPVQPGLDQLWGLLDQALYERHIQWSEFSYKTALPTLMTLFALQLCLNGRYKTEKL